MKLDFKSYLLIAFTILFIIFFSLWYFKGNSGAKDNEKVLKNQIATDQKERNTLTEQRDSLTLAYKNLQFSFNQEDSVVKGLQTRISENQLVIEESQSRLSDYENKLRKTQASIDSLEKSPRNRKGQSLINSLQNKTRQ